MTIAAMVTATFLVAGEWEAIFAAETIAPAAQGNRRRVARAGRVEVASLSGIVTDAVTGAPVSGAVVTLQGKSATTSADGRYSLSSLSSGTETLVVERFGFVIVSRVIALAAGSNSADVALAASATVAVTTTNGVTTRLVLDTVQFSYALGLVSPRNTPNVTVCGTGTGPQSVTLEKSDIALISGPSVTSSSCCPNGQQVNFKLKNGQQFDGTFVDSCAGYVEDLLGRKASDGTNIYIPFKTIRSVQFP
ncbi:MAG TPA: carboxypeptidase regulatory-like domain-containing protein [Thermoanaerobaculia bacterium]|nr:carboxypeptidase regulatory-like domain-containing protein [Thermoanaerobaculia bacterium]